MLEAGEAFCCYSSGPYHHVLGNVVWNAIFCLALCARNIRQIKVKHHPCHFTADFQSQVCQEENAAQAALGWELLQWPVSVTRQISSAEPSIGPCQVLSQAVLRRASGCLSGSVDRHTFWRCVQISAASACSLVGPFCLQHELHSEQSSSDSHVQSHPCTVEWDFWQFFIPAD